MTGVAVTLSTRCMLSSTRRVFVSICWNFSSTSSPLSSIV